MLMRARVLPLPSRLSVGDSASTAGSSDAVLSDVRFLASAGREGLDGSYGETIVMEAGVVTDIGVSKG